MQNNSKQDNFKERKNSDPWSTFKYVFNLK